MCQAAKFHSEASVPKRAVREADGRLERMTSDILYHSNIYIYIPCRIYSRLDIYVYVVFRVSDEVLVIYPKLT